MNWFSQLLPAEASLPAAQHPHHGHVEPQPLPADALLIDVRSYAEYMAGHLPDAHCLPLHQLEAEFPQRWPDRQTPIVLYCATGARSEHALGLLQRLGYRDVHNGGGTMALAQRLGRSLEHGL